MRRLTLICALSEAAPGLIPALTVRLGNANAGLRWREGVFLRHPNPSYASEAIVELVTERELLIEVRAPSPDYFLHVLSDSFEHLARRWKGLSYRQLIACPPHLTTGCSGRFDLGNLLAAQRLNTVTAQCPVCFSRYQVSELLTGFSAPPSGVSAADLSQLVGQLRDITVSVERIDGGVRHIEASAAENAYALRRLLIIAGSEITDCPRLFTLVGLPFTGLDKLKVHRRQFRLTLWCEHPGRQHPCLEGVYVFEKDAEWLRQVSAYIRPVLLILRGIIPLAATLTDMMLTKDQLKHANGELELMEALIAELPVPHENGLDEFRSGMTENPAAAVGADLRSIRQLLNEIDPYRKYGGLRRMLTASGEYLWICPVHVREYDPGLPDV